MSITHLLEDFTLQAGGGKLHFLDEDALEEQRLAAFEQGYSAGWEDAVQAQVQSQGQVSAELAKSLEDMSFTYHEAMNRMSLSLEPMFQSLMQAVLPKTLDRGFAVRLVEQLTDMARTQIGQPMQIFVPTGCVVEVEALIRGEFSSPTQVVEDPSLETGQARLKVGISQREVDCSELLAAVDQAFQAYVFQAKEAVNNE
ncbi:ABC transporter ATP-binding protein [Ruegeria sp. Ofav3-42]|uniref:ABC transporter ATP-binding protein n=1 Tax=Ruegeria sp. Ofav3-42 TaxID=2917759 RepID=UPI001EF5EB26|nr:ABC transporter ATP-binding protein [Ruegeria sp. Ofav3-42]MCG7521092.1 ABC transporter ATP-binding protein [Ruegeria sp. Ofav3-42]